MKKRIIICVTVLLLINSTLGCKKNSVVNTSVTSIDGDIQLVKTTTTDPVVSNRIIIQPTCTFYSVPSNTTTGGADVGSVSLNTVVLQRVCMQPGRPIYSDSTYAINSIPLNWSITGNVGFPALSFSDSGNNLPSFSNFGQLPDTIKKSTGFIFTFNNLTHANVTEVKIVCASQEFSFIPYGNILTITPSQLSAVPISNFSEIQITCSNQVNSIINTNGKNLRFTYTSIYTKYGIVIQ